ncbi:MAG: dNTP triphosphohydrolase [Deltaproteobacteria bacterium]|nr:dNTP triphosphohydrolase [Deltaproteobacteria bacterium]
MLAPYAVRVDESRGRRHPEPPHPYRNDFQRDRDRVIHARAFRRLEAKTQVFTRRYSDHFRNRLTHTIEVSQISRTIAQQLGLNVDLVETLALVHDIGHPPFGHAGERALDNVMREQGLFFDHNLHALRIVEDFEQRYAGFPGLNLTFEVREGIVKHSRDYQPGEFPALTEYLLDSRPPLEAQLIDRTDELAYNTADLDDGYEARLLQLAEIEEHVPVFAEFLSEVETLYPEAPKKLQFNEVLRRILDRWVGDLIRHTQSEIDAIDSENSAALAVDDDNHERRAGGREQKAVSSALKLGSTEKQAPWASAIESTTLADVPETRNRSRRLGSVADIRAYPERLVRLSAEAEAERRLVKDFLYTHLYFSPSLRPEKEDAERIITGLFALWMRHPERLPASYQAKAKSEPLARVVCDYIAGMTDPYISQQYERHCA